MRLAGTGIALHQQARRQKLLDIELGLYHGCGRDARAEEICSQPNRDHATTARFHPSVRSPAPIIKDPPVRLTIRWT
jgi:hypothetical protein